MASCLVSCIGKKELGETFIKVENGYFTKNGIPYYYIGANYWYGAILGLQEEVETVSVLYGNLI